jgi:large subunit ribosomal protein L13
VLPRAYPPEPPKNFHRRATAIEDAREDLAARLDHGLLGQMIAGPGSADGSSVKTTLLTNESARERRAWHLVDASKYRLGRMAAEIATILMGKHRPDYTAHVDSGDYVVVVNAERVRLTGDKRETKTYQHFTGYPSGLRTVKIGQAHGTNPENVVRMAVKRMLPKTVLGRGMLSKLKVFAGPEHEHSAQQPQPREFSV